MDIVQTFVQYKQIFINILNSQKKVKMIFYLEYGVLYFSRSSDHEMFDQRWKKVNNGLKTFRDLLVVGTVFRNGSKY